MSDTRLTDLEASRFIPISFGIAAIIALGLTLMIGASWKFALGLALILGLVIWMVSVADENKRRQHRATTTTNSDFKEQG